MKKLIIRIVLSLIALTLGVLGIYSYYYSELIPIKSQFSSESSYEQDYQKNKWNIYFGDWPIKNADYESFVYLGGRFSIDKDHVFDGREIISELNPEDIKEVIYGKYLLLSDGLYTYDRYENFVKVIEDIDIDSFHKVNEFYAKDKNRAYYYDSRELKVIENADIATFKVLKDGYAIDKNELFYENGRELEKMGGLDLDTIEFVTENIIKDKNAVYILEEEPQLIKEADVSTFKILEGEYTKDKNFVYFYGERIQFADPASFKIISTKDYENFYGLKYSKDKNYIYQGNYILEGENPDNFDINEYETRQYAKFELAVEESSSLDLFLNYFYSRITRNSTSVYGALDNIKWPNLKKKKSTEINSDIQKKWKEDGYYYFDGQIYFNNESPIFDLDIKTFEVLGEGFAKDKNFAYYRANRIWFADADTFEYLGYKYSIDSHSVYYDGQIIEGVDPENFDYLNHFCAKDTGVHVIYCEGEVEKSIDYNSFEILNQKYVRDKNFVYVLYVNLKKLDHVDRDSFRVILGPYGRDKKQLYVNGNVAEGESVDIDSFELISEKYEDYVRDKNGIYYVFPMVFTAIEGADISTFQVLTWSLFKDKNHVYYGLGYLGRNISPIKGADIKTFETISWGYSKDKNAVYHDAQLLTSADYETFEVLDDSYAKDKNQIFYDGKPIEEYFDDDAEHFESLHGIPFKGFDPETFAVWPMGYALDKNHVYFMEHSYLRVLPEPSESFSLEEKSIDPNDYHFIVEDTRSFEYIDWIFARDKFKIYSRYPIMGIDQIDPSSFEVMDDFFIADKNGLYYLEEIPFSHTTIKHIPDIDVDNVVVLGDYYFKYKNSYYYKWRKMESDIDEDSFETIVEGVAKDKNNIFNQGHVIDGADRESLTFVKYDNRAAGGYVQDKYHIYRIDGDILEKIDKDISELDIYRTYRQSI